MQTLHNRVPCTHCNHANPTKFFADPAQIDKRRNTDSDWTQTKIRKSITIEQIQYNRQQDNDPLLSSMATGGVAVAGALSRKAKDEQYVHDAYTCMRISTRMHYVATDHQRHKLSVYSRYPKAPTNTS